VTSEIARLTAQIAESPADAWLYNDRGWLRYEARHRTLALDDFNRAIALDESEAVFWLGRGLVYDFQGYPQLALEAFDRAVALDPDWAWAYHLRGCYYLGAREYQAALDDFDRAVAREPLDPDFQRRRGDALLRLGMLGRALEAYDVAIRLDPKEAYYHYLRAWALLFHNPRVRPEEALPDLEAAIQLDPRSSWYREDRGYIRFCQGSWRDAAEDFACQLIPPEMKDCPEEGAGLVVWHALARWFQGEEATGLGMLRSYLRWYARVSEDRFKAKPLAERLEVWPVPLARFVAGEIDERQFRELPERVPIEMESIEESIGEANFVVGALWLARGYRDEARPLLEKALNLPPCNPMGWAATRLIGG
jgi:tetratricopeptide (TPR) repeat protein